MRNSLELVTRDSVLLMLKLTPAQLDQLLSALHCQLHRRETRLYIRRTAKRLITSLLEPRYGNTSMQDHLDALEEMTFLYRCNNCGELLFFTEPRLGERVAHHCLLEQRTRRELGALELLGAGPLRELIGRHARLFPLEEPQLPTAA